MLLTLLPRAMSATWKSWRTRHLPPHSSTFSWRSRALLLFLFLSLEQTLSLFHKYFIEKVGVCPKKEFKCDSNIQQLCRIDFQCRDHLKCCFYACRKICLDPYEEPCMLPVDRGDCKEKLNRWYFDIEQHQCRSFTYSGCRGNNNNFLSKDNCKSACMMIVKKGQCPLFPYDTPVECPLTCMNDMDCLEREKCCESSCGFICAEVWKVKTGFCPRKPLVCTKIDKPKCLQDSDCPLGDKCCTRCGLKCVEPRH